MYGSLVIVADGGFSKFRKLLHDDQVQVSSHFVGCIMKDCPQVKVSVYYEGLSSGEGKCVL